MFEQVCYLSDWTVCIVGEAKTPDALRNASDQFFEWTPFESVAELTSDAVPKVAEAELLKTEAPKPEAVKPTIKRRPRFLIEAVSLSVTRLRATWASVCWASSLNARTLPSRRRSTATPACCIRSNPTTC